MAEHALLAATRDLIPLIHENAERIENEQRLPDELIDALDKAGLFSAAVPKEFGGPEIDPLVMFDALEMIGNADASTAWVVLIISANPYLFGNALEKQVWQAMYGDNVNQRTAGTLMPGGKALKVDGGYRITGRYRYGSGSEHCEYLLSGCFIFDGDEMCRHENGEPEIRWMIHKTNDCQIIMDSWDSTGLRGSSSHDYTTEDLFVPEDWSFVVGETVHKLANPVYSFSTIPFFQLSAITLGMARAAIDLVKEMAVTKRRGPMLVSEDPAVQMRVAEAEALVGAGRAYVKEVVSDVLNTLNSGNELSWDQRATFRLACTYTLDSATSAINMMYKVGGGSAVYKPNQLDRILRDIHTAGTHIRFNDLSYICAGKMLMGIDPEDPLF